VIGSYTFKKEKNYKYFQQHFLKMLIKICIIFQMHYSHKHEIGGPCYSGKFNNCAIRLPAMRTTSVKFQQPLKERVLLIYADLECTLEKMKIDMETSSYTASFSLLCLAYYVHCSYNNSLCMYQFRRGNDCVAWFAEELKNLAHSVESILSANVPMDFTRDDWQKFNSTTVMYTKNRSHRMTRKYAIITT